MRLGKKKKSKKEELLQNSNFHQIRQIKLQQEKDKAKAEAKKKLLLQKQFESEILDDIEEKGEMSLAEVASPALPQIDESDNDEENKILEEANKFIRKTGDGKTIELVSPNQKGFLRIRNSKIPITSDALRFQELQHIEDTITGMSTMPDFGYEGDNFVIERSQDAPRNWKLLTDFVYNKDKYEWL